MSKNKNNKYIGNKQENWVDDLLERQKVDLEQEEEILSSVPKRIKSRWLDEDEE